MPTGQPAVQTVELYNKLIATPYSTTAELGSLEWQLRSLRRRRPHDAEVAIALLQAFIMQGKAEEAHELATFIWGLRGQLHGSPKGTFILQMTTLGLFNCVFELGPDFPVREAVSQQEMSPYVNAGLGKGDIPMIERILENRTGEAVATLNRFISEINATGLAPHFTSHQETTMNVMRGRFTDYSARVIEAEDGIELAVRFHVRADRRQRRMMEQEIDEALSKYYTGAGVDPYAYVPLITACVMDITAHWRQKPV